ncbi:hypothetical protein ACT3TY_01860 [Halomonas sp. AOP22-C1-8]|uniref:hypothetical protein n=1 Tax=Halomonas sp. AOP22-C1-8 TaxID=3457717 RepID=UPI004034A342
MTKRQRSISEIKRVEDSYTPDIKRIDAIREVMKSYELDGASEGRLEQAARELDLAAYVFRESESDTRIDAQFEHEYTMEPIQRMGVLAAEMLALFNDPRIQRTALNDSALRDSIESVQRVVRITHGALNRRDLSALDKQDGDPKRNRYGLYAALIGCWYQCQRVDEIPRRQRNKEQDACGKYHNFLREMLTAAGVAHIPADEAHRTMLTIEASQP